jgi:endonuclease YncB( thermonuclease family)
MARLTRARSALVAVAACLALAAGAAAQVVEDGGLISVGNHTWRLYGIVVPSRTTACWGDWNAGRAAAKRLEQLVSGRTVDCEYRGKDKDGVDLAVCRADGRDIGADLVSSGLAWSNGNQSKDYVVDEGFSMSRVQGVHARGCRLPAVLLNRPAVVPQPQ